MLHAIIMAGGGGTRLWPVSRRASPKQVLPLLGEETLLRRTYRRLRKGLAPDHIWVATSAALAAQVRRQLPSVPSARMSVEPERRETAPALGLALVRLVKRDPEASFVYVNADNFVRDEREFHRLLGAAERAVRRHPERPVLIGVEPDYPETGYGYIRIGRNAICKMQDVKCFEVAKFVEKPNLVTARRFVASGKYLWNPTLVVGRAARMLELYQRHLPEVARRLERIAASIGTRGEAAVIRREFRGMPSATIDKGILEKVRGMLAIPGNFGWADVGNWRVIHEMLARNPSENVFRDGRHVGLDSSGNLLVSLSGKLVATVGVKGMILVETKDAILLVPRERAQEVRGLVREIERRGWNRYL